jgi:D-3-phosphoglycerate dehydrogenase
MHEKQLPRVLICDPIHDAGLAMLRDGVAYDFVPNLSRKELLILIPQYDGIIVRSTKITPELLDQALRLKIIGKALSSLDGIDVAGAKSKGIEVVYTPDANTLAVAEHTMGLLLAMARRLPWAEAGLREGTWQQSQLRGTGLAGKTLGIVGFGRIGRQVAIRAQAFGMKILVNEIEFTPELALEANVKVVELDQLLALSDFVSLHVTLTPETEHMIGQVELKQMKDAAFLINTARARLVDEDALVTALDDGHIAGAALDVLAGEISPTHPLVLHPNVIATPRIAAFTEDAAREAAVAVAEQFWIFLRLLLLSPFCLCESYRASVCFPMN